MPLPLSARFNGRIKVSKDPEFPQVSQDGRGKTPPKARKLKILETRGATGEEKGPTAPSPIAAGGGGSPTSHASVGNDILLLPELLVLLAGLEEVDAIQGFPGQGSRAPGRTLTLAAGCFPVAVFA